VGSPAPSAFLQRLFVLLGIGIWVGALVFKAWAIPRLSFHWDEFWFLAQVHMGQKGQLPSGFQAFHVLVFSWLPATGTEIDQLRWGRFVAWLGLVVSSGLLYRLARRWVSPSCALVAPVAFLSCWTTMAHGASFRTDSLVLPLLLGVLLALSGRTKTLPVLLGAGALWGLAVLFTVKSIFLAPVALVMLLASGWPGWKKAAGWMASVGAGAMLAMGVFTTWMSLVLSFSPENKGFGTLEGAATKMFEAWWPQAPIAGWVVLQDPWVWALVLLGMVCAWRNQRVLLGVCLSLLPIVFYRNAFDYYYVIMVAPLMLLPALAMQQLKAVNAKPKLVSIAALLVMLGLYSGAAYNGVRVQAAFKQHSQKDALMQAHKAFPNGTRYLDHSGTLVGFEKVNGFLSSWGLENYRETGLAFMPELMKGDPVPLLFNDRETLAPGGLFHDRLLPADQRWIARTYVHYWGPMWVLGTVLPEGEGEVLLAWPGRYRLEGASRVWLDGQAFNPGEVFEKASSSHVPVTVQREKEALPARLVWAEVPAAPTDQAPASFFVLPH
jgi:hypothetical protein